MKLRLLHDWIHVVVEPAKNVSTGGILLVGAQPVRIARVLATGPGRRLKDGTLSPIQVKVGDRFPFFKGVTETKQGNAITMLLDDNEALLRENDVLFLIDGDVEVSL